MGRGTVGWLLVALQFVLLLVLILLPWRTPSVLSIVVGLALVVAGALLGLAAGRRLGRALTPTPVPIAGAGLRTDGAYRWVRHPIYSAVLLMVAGYVIAIGSIWSAAVRGRAPRVLRAQVTMGGRPPARAVRRRVDGLGRADRRPRAAAPR